MSFGRSYHSQQFFEVEYFHRKARKRVKNVQDENRVVIFENS